MREMNALQYLTKSAHNESFGDLTHLFELVVERAVVAVFENEHDVELIGCLETLY